MLGFRVLVLRFRVLGFRVWGLGFGASFCFSSWGSGSRAGIE